MSNQCNKHCGDCAGCGNGAKEGHQCGQSGCASGCCRNREITISEAEIGFLLLLAQLPFLPLARFVKKSTKAEQPESVWLAPVYLNSLNDSIETVQETGSVLRALEEKRLITLDYDKPLQNGDYSLYKESKLYIDFCSAVNESSSLTGFDLASLEYGSIALTSLGQEVLDSLELFF